MKYSKLDLAFYIKYGFYTGHSFDGQRVVTFRCSNSLCVSFSAQE